MLTNDKIWKNRSKKKFTTASLSKALQTAEKLFNRNPFEAFDLLEQSITQYEKDSINILKVAYNLYKSLKEKDRYHLYQGRYYSFDYKSSYKVLDVGSGHIPFPFATHLSDISITNNHVGRAGVPFKYIGKKPVYECNMEYLPFDDKEFDFVYCSHTIHLADNPVKACNELIRVGKSGYIETPKKVKHLLLNTINIDNINWFVEDINGILTFMKPEKKDYNSFGSDVLLSMHCEPNTNREKAFSAMLFLKPLFFNTMFSWDDDFYFKISKHLQKN